MKFTRTNHKTGREYTFESQGALATKITTNGKSIVVEHPIDQINQSYYDWQNRGKFIQDAFRYLNADEREFIMTGTTKEEWAAMFPPDGDEK